MNLIEKSQAIKVLDPHLEKLKTAFFNSVNFYLTSKDYAAVRHRHSFRSDASIIHDLIVDEIEKEFKDVKGAYCHTKRNLFTLVINSQVVLRFKKFGKNLLSSGINTQQLVAFNLQDPTQLELPGMPPHGLLHVGYLLNDLRTGVRDLYITYRYQNQNVWVWNVTGIEKEKIIPVEFPTTTTIPTPSRKVTAKRKDKGVGELNEGNN